jgi:acetoin:2,6-dichlorophenolindophenol oxidoreductase subunit beta
MPNKKKRLISFAESVREAQILAMKKDKNVLLIGLGVDDPKGVFGTTKGIKEIFKKKERVFDFPTAENAMTGIAIGASITGKKPIIVHQRVEFALLSLEQIINQAAKWFFMSGGISNVPLVIRLIIGRGWGQGPQHSQSLESIFSHIPGLKVVSLSTPKSAKGIILASVIDKNPVIIFEHRWLHDLKGNVPKKYFLTSLDKAEILRTGNDITLISSSYMVIECLRSASILKKFKIKAEVVDLRSLRPLDSKTIIKSVKKTKNVLIVDNGWMSYGIGSEIMARIFENLTKKEKKIFKMYRIGPMDAPVPSTRALAKFCYKDYRDIVRTSLQILKKESLIKLSLSKLKNNTPSDQPSKNFLGPF